MQQPSLLDASGIVFGADKLRPWLAQRSLRSLRAAGLSSVATVGDDAAWPDIPGHVILIRAGAWLRNPGPLKPPPASATGRGALALGHAFTGKDARRWHDERRQSGGHFEATAPPLVCAALDVKAREQCSITSLLQQSTALDALRVFHWTALDVDEDDRMRCLQIVTSLQHGGAERIALDLANELPRQNIPTRMVILGNPLRSKLPEPPGLIDLSGLDRERRATEMKRVVALAGTDVLHAHLVDAEDARAFSADGTPLVMTLHNTRAAWPEGMADLRAGDASLLIACSQMVEREMQSLGFPIPIRCVWNGIRVDDIADAVKRSTATKRENDFTLACVANPRPQKRLHLLPAILAATRDAFATRGLPHEVKLIIAGETSPLSPSAVECMRLTLAEAERLGVSHLLHVTEGHEPVTDVLARSDVLVCCSAHEGLSLAHLEGLAAGLPLVSTDAGGTAEIAWQNKAVTLLALDASPETFADAIVSAMANAGKPPTLNDFTTQRMAARCAWLYRRVLPSSSAPSDEVSFITNNLSTGGAQSSLRRLVKAFHAEGRRVRVALLQEDEDNPTPGRIDLEQAGIPVMVLPKAGTLDAQEAVQMLLDAWSFGPDTPVVFWNVIPIYKMLIADGLLHSPVFDVSPGEMFFASLTRYFENPRPALPYRNGREYGARLAGVVVKYQREAALAAEVLGARTMVIANGINARIAPQRGRTERFTIGTAARINPQKRLEDLIEAFKLALPNLPPCVLKIAGGVEIDCDDYAEQLRAMSAGLPVEWLGEVQDIAAFHAGLDVFAMIAEPAGCPNASLEAMASGLPVVATDVGGANEQVIDCVNGRLVPGHDPPSFAAALVELADDESKRLRMGQASIAHVEERFSMKRMVNAYRALLFPTD